MSIFEAAFTLVFTGAFIGIGLGITYAGIAAGRGLYSSVVGRVGRYRNRRQGDLHLRGRTTSTTPETA